MQQAEFAALLVDAGDAEREALLQENSALANVELAYALKEICWGAWSDEPGRSVRAAGALRALAGRNGEEEISALAEWVGGIADLVEGRMEQAIAHLDAAQARLLSLGMEHSAAATQVSKLIALSMLGRYDEAIDCGLGAREVFLAHGDLLAAGKIEHNIGNLFFRRDRYHEADEFQSAARERFKALNDQKQLATINNCLANTRALLHQFKSAEDLYQQAVEQAETSDSPVTLAEIEGNMGSFALLQGRYDLALDYLERSRRRYGSLGMTPQSVSAEHEIADAYLELNLAPEAAEIYERVIPKFAELGMRADEARARAYYGRSLIRTGRTVEAQKSLLKAHELYVAEGNNVGAAMVDLTQAQLHYSQRNYERASMLAAQAEPALLASGSSQRLLLSRWLQGEAERAAGNIARARSLLEPALHEAERKDQPQVAERCLTSLGLLASSAGDPESAANYFRRAISLTEALRAPLPSDEFRTAFFSERLVPYNEMVRLSLAAGRIAEALGFVESARSRALVDTLGGSVRLSTEPRDEFEADLLRQIETLRGELNYLYNQLNRPVRGVAGPNQSETLQLQQELREREGKLLGIARQLQHRGEKSSGQVEAFALPELQIRLGTITALVEYATIDNELLAFVVTNERVEVFRNLGVESEVAAEIEQFRFQIDTLRYGSASIRKHLSTLTQRVLNHLSSLYDQLLRPMEEFIGGRRLVVVPHRSLHYLPFQALHDGTDYLIQHREISYSPSANVLKQCLDRPAPGFSSALLMGVADEQIPRVREEVEAIGRVLPKAKCFLDKDATIEILRDNSQTSGLIHLACHAQFRSDNPLFSSLRLGDGWLTVRDAYGLKFNSGLVTLSACETGVNAVAPGDELIGMARGFFSAGSPSVLITLWTVDDEATAELMVDFYQGLTDGQSPSSALREAQMKMLKERPHPFFWAPFVLVGRW